jgi:hypothetical protein
VEQTATGGLEDAGQPTEVYGSPIIATIEEDQVTGLQVECRPDGTWVERLPCPSSPPSWHGWHPPTEWRHS